MLVNRLYITVQRNVIELIICFIISIITCVIDIKLILLAFWAWV